MPGLTQNTLEQLRPIHLPDPIGYWPIALGWQLLFILSILLLLSGLYVGWRYYHRGLAKREALRLLLACEQAHRLDPNTQRSCATIVDLLKRVALVYYPREQVADLYGDAWFDFLQKTSKKLDFSLARQGILIGPYLSTAQADAHSIDVFACIPLARQWIKQRRKPCSS